MIQKMGKLMDLMSITPIMLREKLNEVAGALLRHKAPNNLTDFIMGKMD
jgi:hypothetical protein